LKAALYYGKGDVRVEDVAEPEPGPGELMLEVHAVGICGTDLDEYVHGPKSYAVSGHPVTGHTGPLIPGHEFSGRVVDVGPGVERFEIGALVATGAGISCGACYQCLRGRTSLCVNYSTLGLHRHGGLAQYCAVPEQTCLDVSPYELDEDTAALAQPMAIAVHSLRRGRPEPGDQVLVLGAGGIGAFLVYAAAQLGARVGVVDIDDRRLALAGALGATELFDGREDLAEQTSAKGFRPDVVYEVTGLPAVLRQGLAVLPPGGRIVVVGLQPEPHPVALRDLTLEEIEIVGTNAHTCAVDLPEALRLLGARGGTWSDVAPVVLALDELVERGLEPMARGASDRIKTLLDPWAASARERS
jgi:(R,R)-butanediol dehydrogenase/meso-butanediol dehydrogenase/diacetyl reductase